MGIYRRPVTPDRQVGIFWFLGVAGSPLNSCGWRGSRDQASAPSLAPSARRSQRTWFAAADGGGGWGGAACQQLTVGSDPGLRKSGSAPLADVPQASGPDSRPKCDRQISLLPSGRCRSCGSKTEARQGGAACRLNLKQLGWWEDQTLLRHLSFFWTRFSAP